MPRLLSARIFLLLTGGAAVAIASSAILPVADQEKAN